MLQKVNSRAQLFRYWKHFTRLQQTDNCKIFEKERNYPKLLLNYRPKPPAAVFCFRLYFFLSIRWAPKCSDDMKTPQTTRRRIYCDFALSHTAAAAGRVTHSLTQPVVGSLSMSSRKTESHSKQSIARLQREMVEKETILDNWSWSLRLLHIFDFSTSIQSSTLECTRRDCVSRYLELCRMHST